MAARGTPTDGEAAEDRALGPDHAFVASQRVAPFVQRLRELGWIEGRTVAIEYRWAEGRNERAAEIAAEFVRLKVDVIVTQGTPSVIAAKQATSVIPIVFAAVGDPIGSGLVASLSRPGGNVTGLSTQQTDTGSKLIVFRRGSTTACRCWHLIWFVDRRSYWSRPTGPLR